MPQDRRSTPQWRVWVDMDGMTTNIFLFRSLGFSQTLGSLGFAPNETLEDFLDMTFNPEPMETPPVEQDPVLGSEQDQRAYYELLMGRRFT